MNRIEFKQRMQKLKSYRDENPGKTYLDFRAYEDGGETKKRLKAPYPSFYNGRRVNPWTGQPIATGAIKPVFDLEDAANLTPVGDAITVKDMTEAVGNRDWIGLGIASLGFIPMVGHKLGRGASRRFHQARLEAQKESKDAIRRAVPIVDKESQVRQLNRIMEDLQKQKATLQDPNYKITDISDANNARNEVLGDLNKDYFDKARSVDSEYGTNYEEVYNSMLEHYNDPIEYLSNTPYVQYQPLKNNGQGNVRFAPDEERAFEIAVEGSSPSLKDYVVTAGKGQEATKGTVYHEMSHIADGMQNPSGTFDIKDNGLLQEVGDMKHFKQFKEYNDAAGSGEKITEEMYRYLTNPLEMKAFVNTARSDMAQLGIMNKRTQNATKEQINKYLQHPEAHGSLKKIFKLHKDPDQFNKMFNSMPYLGLMGLGVYNYLQDRTKDNGQYLPSIPNTHL